METNTSYLIIILLILLIVISVARPSYVKEIREWVVTEVPKDPSISEKR